MSNVFFISDTHFGHANCLKFKLENGQPLREFSCVEEMDEHMVAQWNSVVTPKDKVYHLGDVVMHKRSLCIMDRLNGTKKLIMGNHDIFGAKEYLKYFYDVSAYRVFPKEGFICSHIPIHMDDLSRFQLNVHGHLHGNVLPDKRYKSVCVEQVSYTPVPFEDIIKIVKHAK